MSQIKHFITFGSNHKDANGVSLGNRYMIIEGESWEHIREQALRIRGRKFCTDYPINKLEDQIKKYNLKEVSQEAAQLHPAEVRASLLSSWGLGAST